MYPYLFGVSSLPMYDLIGVLGYGVIAVFFLCSKRRRDFFGGGRGGVWVPLAVHFVIYTFGGVKFGGYIGRGTDFFGYVALSAVAMVLTAVVVQAHPLHWLDRTAPLYATLAALLKASCFCGGCCYGYPWAQGLYNQRTGQTEFPIQLVEMVAYGLLLVLLRRYSGRMGQRFALFLSVYGTVRFLVQFFRADVVVFTPFHWMSAVFVAVGILLWVVCALVPATDVSRETPGARS